MQRYIIQRVLQGVLVLLLVATIVFFLGRLTGNPADLMLPEDATPEDRQALIATLGLDRPYYEQLYIFLLNAVQGDLGVSIRYRQPAAALFFDRLPNTLQLVPATLALAVGVALPLGMLAAVYRGSMIDKLAGAAAVCGIATPSFWLGIVLIYVFSVQLGWLPSARMGGMEHYVLPSITLGLFLVAGLMRLVRSSMLEVLDTEFVKLARLKGLRELVIVLKHCLRNALIPVITLFGVLLAQLVTGAIVTETVFAWPGIGRLTFEAVLFRDYPLLQAVVVLDAILVLGITLMVDILYAYIDPRIRYS
ncbi:MAG: ABC transporter permease [Candidatus Tectomicrobia bacterium]|uniref:ABC transporter permease n=1 Tax=Tectimicrobiota bacterium TaxID=2528274 RepID=A0A938B5W9_UNCTE|nr:ABC transporter permease [Candidatus Tectomicrobia bacterium]